MSILCSTSIRTAFPMEEALEKVAELGFKNIDLLAIGSWCHINPADLVSNFDAVIFRVEKALATSGLQIKAMNTGTNQQLHDRSAQANADRRLELDALSRFMKHFGVQVAAIQPLSKDYTRDWKIAMEDCVSTLKEQKEIGEQYGVTFALELHVHSPFETMEQAQYFLEKMPEMPLVYDPTHFIMQGFDIRSTGWIMDKAKHVHIRDAGKDLIQTHFGEGNVDFDWVLSELKARKYNGHFSIEYLYDENLDIIEDVKKMRDRIAQYFPEV